MRTDPAIYRFATDEDGTALGKLFQSAQYPDHNVDWTKAGVGGWWLVAERDGELRGAIQIIASRPWAYIGEVIVHPDERGRRADGRGSLSKRPGAIGYRLYMQALVLLQEAGVEMVMGIVNDRLPGLQKIMRRYGVTEIGRDYKLYGMRLS